MNHSIKKILALTCFTALSSAAYGALPLKYSFDQLNGFWSTQVPAPDMSFYGKLMAQKTAASGKTLEIGNDDIPPDELMNVPSHGEEVVGQFDFPAGAATQLVIFPVISPSRSTAGMMKRNAILQSYFSKERLFTQTGTSDQIALIEQRRNAAQLEMYLINLVRFAQSRSLADRCQLITNTQFVAKNLKDRLLQRGALPVPSGFENLSSTYDTVSAAYDLDSLKRLSCSARTVASKSELLRMMQARAATRLLDSSVASNQQLLFGYDDRQKTVMKAQLARYTAVETAVESVDMMVAKLIKLRDNLGNIRSSYQLVKDDTFGLVIAPAGIQSSIQQLGAIPYPQLKIDFSVADGNLTTSTDQKPKYKLILDASQAQYNDVIGDKTGLKAILKSYVDLYAAAPASLQTVLLPCSSLLADFSTVESAMVSGNADVTTVQKFKTGFAACLGQATDAFVAQQAANETQYNVDDSFARLLSILSSTVIDVKKRPN